MSQCFACGATEDVTKIVAKGNYLYACPAHKMLARKVAKHEGQPVTPGTRDHQRKLGGSASRKSEPAERPSRQRKNGKARRPFRGKPTPRKMVKAAQAVIDEVMRQHKQGVSLSDDTAQAVEDLQGACAEWRAKRLTPGVLERYNSAGEVLRRWLEEHGDGAR